MTNPSSSRVTPRRLSIVLTAAFAVLVGAIVSDVGLAALDAPVKLAVVLVIGAACAALVFYRPLLFPLAAYMFAVPFDTLLQTGPGTITKFLGVASAVVMLLVLTDRRRSVGAPFAVLPWAAYMAWSVASYLWSEVPMYRNELLSAMIELFAIFTIASTLRIKTRELAILLGAAMAGGTGLACLGLYLFRNAPSAVSGSASDRLAIRMNNSSYVNADHFAAAMVMPITLALVATLHFRGWKKVPFAIMLLIMMAGVSVSGTRGTLIAVGATWLYLLIFYGKRVQLCTIAAVGLSASLFFPNVWNRFLDPNQGEAGGRFSIWGIAWDAFKHRPWFGIGVDQFRLAYGESYLHAAHGRLITPWIQDPHNLIVSNAVELGLVGLVLIVAAWFFQLRIAAMVPRSSRLFGARLAAEGATVGLFVNAISLDIMFYKYLWVAFCVGAFVRSAYLNETEAAASESSIVHVQPEAKRGGAEPAAQTTFAA